MRRSAASVAGLALSAGLTGTLQAASGRKIPIGLQLYSIRQQAEKAARGDQDARRQAAG